MRRHALTLLIVAGFLAACSGSRPDDLPGLRRRRIRERRLAGRPAGSTSLLVQRGADGRGESAALQARGGAGDRGEAQADEQLKASQAQLADLRVGRRNPELDVAQAQLAQAVAAEAAGGAAAASATRRSSKSAASRGRSSRIRARTTRSRRRGCGSSQGQLDVSRLPAREDQIRAQERPGRGRARRVEPGRAGGSIRSASPRPKAGSWSTRLYREGEWVPAGSPVVRMLPPGNVKLRFFVPEAVAGRLEARPQLERALRRLRRRSARRR